MIESVSFECPLSEVLYSVEGSYINGRSGERERGGDVSERPHSGGNLLVQLSQFCLPLLQLLPQLP